MSRTRATERADRSAAPTPPQKPSPSDDPAWAFTLAIGALAAEARRPPS